MTAVRTLLAGSDALGEGPAWDAATGRLVWTDLLAGTVYAAALPEGPAAQTDRTVLSRHSRTVSAVLPRRGGGYALCAHDEIVMTDADGRQEGRRALALREGMRLSDACATPEGDILVGEVDESMRRPGRVIRVFADGERTETVLDGMGFANGMGFSPDGTTLHVVDSGGAGVTSDRYGGADATLDPSARLTVPQSMGTPDGLAVDATGALWIALFGGGGVARFFPGSSEPLETITMPARQVASCAFAGPDADLLVITTATVDLTPEELAAQPGAGSIFAASPGVRGAPVWKCAL